MPPEKNQAFSGNLLSNIRLAIVCATIGVVTGLAWAITAVLAHGYVSVGFWKTTFWTVRDCTTYAGLVGSAFAVVFVLARFPLGLARSKTNQVLRVSILLKHLYTLRDGLWPYVICQTCGLSLTAYLIFINVRRRYPFGVILVTFLCCGGFAIWRTLINRFPNLSISLSTSLSTGYTRAVCAVLLYLVYLGCFPIFSKMNRHLLGKSIYAAELHTLYNAPALMGVLLLLSCLVITFFLARWHIYRCQPEKNPSDYHHPKGRRLSILPILLVLISLPAVFWGLSPFVSTAAPRPSNPLNLVLIAIDTLRADHTSLPGSPIQDIRDLTPNLRRLAKRGTTFQSAISQAPWTKPAMASILTGKYPHEHGAVLFHGALTNEQTTLAEVLREAGYHTGAVVSCDFVNTNSGFAQGFCYFNEDYVLDAQAITSEYVTNLALDFIKKQNDRNFFLYIHYYDPHWDYRNHEGWDFADDYNGWLADREPTITYLWNNRHVLDSTDIRYLVDLYDEEIVHTDKEVGRLLGYIEQQGLTQSTAIVFVADHGEEFMERGWLGHVTSLYDEQIRVPMVFVLPGINRANPLVYNTVETRSIFSTVLDYLGLQSPISNGPQSLIPMISYSSTERTDQKLLHTAFSSTWTPDTREDSASHVRASSVRTNSWKLILDHMHKKKYLFNLNEDFGETVNLALDNPDKVREMSGEIVETLNEISEYSAEASQLGTNQESTEKLRALGYI